MKTSEKLSDFLSFCRAVSSSYKEACSYIEIYDKETQDLLHQIELGPYKQRNSFATKLAHTRQRRRLCKDVMDVNEELVNYMLTPEFIKVQRQLEQILGICRKQEKYISQRAYRSKIRNDLTINQIGEKQNE